MIVRITVPRSNEAVWDRQPRTDGAYPWLSDNCYEWLSTRQHLVGGMLAWFPCPQDSDSTTLAFRDTELAMLFKLTWVGL